MKLAHIADIHIRSNTRHDEYRKVFNQVYKKLIEENVDKIILCGDLAHTKTQESPEFYNFTAEFLTNLSKIAPVHIILGNHDGLIDNKDRLDVITPIINMLNNPKLHLHKQSERVDLEQDFSLFTYSLFDKANWNNWEIDNNRINIALFHGTISGAKTDSSYYLEGDINIDEFNRYDFVFVGDVHCAQQLDTKGRIRFSGSLIQQNYGEDLEKGFLIWDIQSKDEFTNRFITLDPVHPYFTFIIENIDNTDVSSYNFVPKLSRIRLKFVKEFDARAIDKLAQTFKHELNAEEVITITDIQDNKGSIVLDSQILKLEDLNDQKIQEQLIGNFLLSHHLSDDIAKMIFEINAQHNEKILTGTSVRGVNWKINKLNFSNMFSFKEDNVINFDKLKGIVGVFGPNGIGKSSIIDIILYGIFNNNSKGIVKNLDIINTRKRTCSVKLDVSVNNARYIIDRLTTKLAAGKRVGEIKEHARTDLDFYKIENDVIYSLNGSQRSDTEKNIRDIFGSFEDFLTTCVAAQGDMNNFVALGSARRKETVGKFLDLELFDKKYKFAKEEALILKTQLKNFEGKNFNVVLEENRKNEKELKQQLLDLKNKKIELTQTLKVEHDTLSNLSASYESIKYIDDYNNTRKSLETLEEKKSKLNNELDILLSEHVKLNNAILSVKHTNYNEEILRMQNELSSVINELHNINTLQIKKEKESIKHEQFEHSIELLSDIPCEDKFPNCKFIKNSFESKEKIQVCEDEIERISNEINSLNKKLLLEQKEKLTNEKLKLDADKTELSHLTQTVEYNALLIKNKKLEIQNITSNIKNMLNKKLEFENLKVHDLDTAALKINIECSENKIKEIEFDIRQTENTQLVLSKKLGITQNNTKILINEQKTLKEISDVYYAYELYMRAMSRNGIPQAIIKNKLSFINSEIDKLLRNIVKFKIKLVDDDDKLEIYIDYKDGKARTIETTGGAERAFASLAIRVALTRISTLPKPNIFIIDESFGTYDEMNRLNVSKILQLLKQYFTTILVVTHIDDIKDCVDYILTVDRDQDKFSYMS